MEINVLASEPVVLSLMLSCCTCCWFCFGFVALETIFNRHARENGFGAIRSSATTLDTAVLQRHADVASRYLGAW